MRITTKKIKELTNSWIKSLPTLRDVLKVVGIKRKDLDDGQYKYNVNLLYSHNYRFFVMKDEIGCIRNLEGLSPCVPTSRLYQTSNVSSKTMIYKKYFTKTSASQQAIIDVIGNKVVGLRLYCDDNEKVLHTVSLSKNLMFDSYPVKEPLNKTKELLNMFYTEAFRKCNDLYQEKCSEAKILKHYMRKCARLNSKRR